MRAVGYITEGLVSYMVLRSFLGLDIALVWSGLAIGVLSFWLFSSCFLSLSFSEGWKLAYGQELGLLAFSTSLTQKQKTSVVRESFWDMVFPHFVCCLVHVIGVPDLLIIGRRGSPDALGLAR